MLGPGWYILIGFLLSRSLPILGIQVGFLFGLRGYIAKILESLEKLVEMEKEKEGSGNDFNEK